ncbi:MAG TPA: hypothetical protein VMN36_08740 [Verrucomicrobiales bacterium]|nr:hypothetical protein [Verrucomicrobiales bacterium]
MMKFECALFQLIIPCLLAGAVGGCATWRSNAPRVVNYSAQVERLHASDIEIAKVDFIAVPVTDTQYEATCEVTYRNRGTQSPVLLLFETWSSDPDRPVAGVVLLNQNASDYQVAKSAPFLTDNKDGPIAAKGAGYKAWLGHSL